MAEERVDFATALARMVAVLDMMADGPDAARVWFREHERYGDISLSVQASELAYCKPQINGLPLEQYESVEVALIRDDKFVLPDEIGLPEFSRLFPAGRQVAPYVSQADLARLREALKQRQELTAGREGGDKVG